MDRYRSRDWRIFILLSQINPSFKSIGFESSYAQHKMAIDYGVKSRNETFDP
jgi:hypothetical protein